MKKKIVGVLSFLACACLASCADTSELYDGDAYIGKTFLGNRYNLWSKGLKEAYQNVSSDHEKTLPYQATVDSPKGYFNGSGNFTSPAKCRGMDHAISLHHDDFLVDKEDPKSSLLRWTATGTYGGRDIFDSDIISNGIGKWADQSPLYDVVYGQTKKMSRLHSGFSRGYLSKLYNGQIQCDAWSSYSLVAIDKEGYGTLFPAELESAKYYAMSLRGGSDTNDSHAGRITIFDINVTFYKRNGLSSFEGFTVHLDDVKLQTNYSAECTSLVGFYFEDVGYDPRGVVGMSITYSLVADEATFKPILEDGTISDSSITVHPSDDYTDGADYHTGIMVLEVFFPDSSWN